MDGHAWYRIDMVESASGTVNALYLIDRFQGPPLRSAALLICEKTRELEWGRFTIVGIVGYDDGYVNDVLESLRSIRQAPAD